MSQQARAGTPGWWRPITSVPFDGIAVVLDTRPVVSKAAPVALNPTPVAFNATLAFTVILVLAPQQWIPGLAQLRIALVAGLIALGAWAFRSSLRCARSKHAGRLHTNDERSSCWGSASSSS